MDRKKIFFEIVNKEDLGDLREINFRELSFRGQGGEEAEA